MQRLEPDLSEKLTTLRQCSYFANLESDLLQKLALGMSLARFERGEVLFWQDDPCIGLYMLRRGSVKLFKLSPRGRELIFRVLSEGASFNEVPVFDGGLNPVNAAALEDSQIWVVEAPVIRSAMYQYPAMCQSVILNLTQNLRSLVGIVEELSFYQVTHRLARLIAQLPVDQTAGAGDLCLTQDELAARLGTVREVVARSLRDLERSGAIRVARRQIRVVDLERLRDWVQEP